MFCCIVPRKLPLFQALLKWANPLTEQSWTPFNPRPCLGQPLSSPSGPKVPTESCQPGEDHSPHCLARMDATTDADQAVPILMEAAKRVADRRATSDHLAQRGVMSNLQDQRWSAPDQVTTSRTAKTATSTSLQLEAGSTLQRGMRPLANCTTHLSSRKSTKLRTSKW